MALRDILYYFPAFNRESVVPRAAHQREVPSRVQAPEAAVGRGWPDHRVLAVLQERLRRLLAGVQRTEW